MRLQVSESGEIRVTLTSCITRIFSPILRNFGIITRVHGAEYTTMAVHPIEYRYGTTKMRHVWSEEHRLWRIADAEIALAKAEAMHGMIPEDDASLILEKAHNVSLDRVKEIEAEISHDMMAIVSGISEVCGEAGRWVHYGATSNDILDTATGLQLKDALDLIEEKLFLLLEALLQRAESTKHLVCIARTHGQHGVPMTYGLRFAIWASEIGRHIDRLHETRQRVCVGQLTGAVGTQAALGALGPQVQESMMKYLSLVPVDVSNQVIQRDRYAEYFCLLAQIATTLDKIGIEIRSLQRTEIGEVEEAFGKKQVGSSTMPHKRNPIKSEQVCGLARVIRSAVEPAFQNNTLWDERDLTNSSCERVLFPEASILCDHILNVMVTIIENLHIKEDRVLANLSMLHGVNMAESVMIELTKRGMSRQVAHEVIRTASMDALADNKPLYEILSENKEVTALVSKDEIEKLLDPRAYIGTAVEQVERVVLKLRKMKEE